MKMLQDFMNFIDNLNPFIGNITHNLLACKEIIFCLKNHRFNNFIRCRK